MLYFQKNIKLKVLNAAENAVGELYLNGDKSCFADDISDLKISQVKNIVARLDFSDKKMNLSSEVDAIRDFFNIKCNINRIFKNGILMSQNQNIINKLNEDFKKLKASNERIYVSLKKELDDINEQNLRINETKDKINKLLMDENTSREEYNIALIDVYSIKNLSIKENILSSLRKLDDIITEKVNQGFSDVKSIDPSIIVDLKYASGDNFTGKKIYDFKNAIARTGSCKKLARANEMLKASGYMLKLWDAYRPIYAQEALWDAYPDPNFVEKPDYTYSNELGATFDVTLCDLDGNEIRMQSSFEEFSDKAYRNYHRSYEEDKYYKILDNAMTNAGFIGHYKKWWNYTDRDESKYIPVQVDPKLYRSKF
jgi:D-alanyl-D-alanine dipeptidase